MIVKGFPSIPVEKPKQHPASSFWNSWERVKMEIVNDSAPAEIEEMFAKYADTGHVVLPIDRYARVDAEVQPARAVWAAFWTYRNRA